MLPSYDDQLLAIREMLADPAPEIEQEGYDLLFRLWLSNHENMGFKHELLRVAVNHSRLIIEFTNRLRELQLNNSITNTYLRKELETLASDVYALKFNPSITGKPITNFQSVTTKTPQENEKYAWWQLLLFGIITASVWLVVYVLPDLYQKILVAFVALASAITLPYIFPQKDRVILIDSAGIKINYSFPTYLSIRDENIAHVAIENTGQTDFNGRITLVFDDPSSFVTPAPDQNLSVKVDLSPHGRESKQFKFLVLKRPSDKNLNYHFEITSDKEQYKSNEESFLIAPIPYLRYTWAWLFGSAGVIIALLWDQFEKIFGAK